MLFSRISANPWCAAGPQSRRSWMAGGQPAGVCWHGGCGRCDHYRRGDFFACVTGLTYDGGYAEFLIAPASAVAGMPVGLDPVGRPP